MAKSYELGTTAIAERLRARPEIRASFLGVEAPARQGARSAHTGRMQATSNAARRDASAARMAQLFPGGPIASTREPVAVPGASCADSADALASGEVRPLDA